MQGLEDAVESLLPDGTELADSRGVGGGCISAACRLHLRGASGELRTLFAKSNDASFADNFACERDGLQRLADTGTIGVPRPVASGTCGGRAWLFLEWVEAGSRDGDFYADFGRDLAALHEATLGSSIGLDRDNYLGSARQPNEATSSWTEFVADRRLGFQLRWATNQGLADGRLRQDVAKVIARLPDLLDGRRDETSLLHGDLWSGNYLADSSGRPVIIDPAVYHGCREAEFGMIELFGSCRPPFYEAYQEALPMPGGWQRRASVYVLYHLLNHLNLFGGGYASQCRSVASRLLRA